MLHVIDEDRVRLLTLDRPEARNAFNEALYDAVTEALIAAAADPNVAVVVITGSAGAFSAGTDLLEMAARMGPGFTPGVHGFPGMVDQLAAFPKPLMLAVNGLALGIGATMLGFADLVFMSTEARIKCPFTSLAVAPEAASSFLFPRLLGRQAATWVLLSSEWISAAECHEAGLAWKICEPDDLIPTTMRHAKVLAAKPISSLVESKLAVIAPLAAEIEAARQRENGAFQRLMGAPANIEALRAFAEKRQPDFTGIDAPASPSPAPAPAANVEAASAPDTAVDPIDESVNSTGSVDEDAADAAPVDAGNDASTNQTDPSALEAPDGGTRSGGTPAAGFAAPDPEAKQPAPIPPPPRLVDEVDAEGPPVGWEQPAALRRHLQLGDLIEVLADAIGDRPALITHETELTYAQLDERATRLANHLAAVGVGPDDRVGIHAMNCPEWVEAFYACAKIRAAAVNVNYRYVAAELRYLYDNADCVAVIAAPEYRDVLDEVADALPRVRHRLFLGDEYEAALTTASPERNFPERSPDDHYVLYTGGTTGMPKGVIWRHEDIILGAMNAGRGGRPIERIEQLGEEAAAAPGQMRIMALGPLMHGGSQWAMGNAHVGGGVFIASTVRRFDPHAILDLAARAGAHSISTIGDAMARPLAEALLEPGAPAYDLSNLFSIGNGGAPLSTAVRRQIRQALPNVMILDSFGASETGAAGARADGGEEHSAPRFNVGPDTTVLDDDGNQCAPGVIGKLARSGHIPLGYHGDPEKTAATFKTFAGRRWVIPGDFAQIEDDGSISVLGRGSVSINSGGEKIFPEEVEAALKQHPAVYDAVAVGTPNERWGEQVTALVQLRAGSTASPEELTAHTRTLVADYKAPKAVLFVDVVQRTPVGKADYQWAKSTAIALLTDAAPDDEGNQQ